MKLNVAKALSLSTLISRFENLENISVVLVILILIQVSNQEAKFDSKIVTLKYGKVQGRLINLSAQPHLQPVQVFLGIPYASPPIGKLRFMPPVTSDHWKGIKQAVHFGPACPQKLPDISNMTEALQRMTLGRYHMVKSMITRLQNQSEDCLYLNIYSPANATSSNSSLPVMMFIHGESYEWNSGSNYDGSILASYGNVIVVTINYRLGVFGFFSTIDGTSRGNFGLMDQVAALHWIQENIAHFGGDNKNVTIFGQGQGATCVNLLMLSPMAKGLFHRSIIESGSSLSSWAMANQGVKYSRDLAQSLACSPKKDTNFDILDCLRSKSVTELLAVNLNVSTYLTGFGPTVDGIVIPNDPFTLMSEDYSQFGTYDLLFGVNRFESYNQFSAHDEQNGISPSRRDKILRTLVRNLFSFHLQEIFLTILNEYTDWSRPTLNPFSIFESLLELLSDALIVGPTIKTGLLHSRLKSKSYFYHFAHSTQLSEYHSKLGSIHGEELLYVFGQPLLSGHSNLTKLTNFTQSEVKLSESVMTYWTNFAKYGDPNINDDNTRGQDSNSEQVMWPSYDDDKQKYLQISLKPSVKNHYHVHRLSYWFHLLPKLHTHRMTASSYEHHLLDEHDNPLSFEGQVRDSIMSSNHLLDFKQVHFHEMALIYHRNNSMINPSFHNQNLKQMNHLNLSSAEGQAKSAFDNKNFFNNSFSMINEDSIHSTALRVTIAVGCSLLILNILVFVAIFFHRDRGFRDQSESFEVPFTASNNCLNRYEQSSAKLTNHCSSLESNPLTHNYTTYYNNQSHPGQTISNQTSTTANMPCNCHLCNCSICDHNDSKGDCKCKSCCKLNIIQERSANDQYPVMSDIPL